MKKVTSFRLLSLFLTLILLCTSFSSCAQLQKAVIAEKGHTDYVIIRPASTQTASTMNDTVNRLQSALEETFETDFEVEIDWYDAGETTLPEKAKEILIGKTNRTETANALAKIRENDFIITYENERLVILGGSDEATARACDYFIENYINTADGKLRIPKNIEIIDRSDYPFLQILVDGVDIRKYSIVYHASETASKYTAQNLSDMIYEYAGVKLNCMMDTAEETEYEILIGGTNRQASSETAQIKLADDEFLLCKSGTKILMQGNGYMCAGAAGKFMNVCLTHDEGNNVVAKAENIPDVSSAQPEKPVWETPQNVILMIGDGMGRNQVLKTLQDKKITRWEGDAFPCQAYCSTSSLTEGHTDSAAAATALATGYKTTNGRVGRNAAGQDLQNICEFAHAAGINTAVLTTDSITGATPSGFLAHADNRSETENLQAQIDAKIANGEVQFCKGAVGDALQSNFREALLTVSGIDERFFIMLEESTTDSGGHANEISTVTSGVKRLNDSVIYAATYTMLHPDTALIVTADHECGGLVRVSGDYIFTSTAHTNADVPVYGLGAGVKDFLKSGKIDNLDLSRFIAGIYGATSWGQS